MKIRISGNSVRLRLSQSEVKTFLEKGAVSEQVRFGAGPESMFVYELRRSGAAQVSASLTPNRISVLVPADLGNTWASAEQEIGIEHTIRFADSDGGTLRILIEKDFKCLADRAGEDESDNFPNPTLNC